MFKIIYSLLMLAICTTTGCISDDEPEGPSLSVGDPLPQFSVTLNTGKVITTNSLQGKVGVIVFFNTECSDCRVELPVIQSLWEEYRNNDSVELVAIAREETKEEIEKYWEEKGFTMPFSPQHNREVYNLFAYSIIPRIYISNFSGVIYTMFDDEELPSLDLLITEIERAKK